MYEGHHRTLRRHADGDCSFANGSLAGRLVEHAPPGEALELPCVPAGTLGHLRALSQALHQELKPYGLRVQALCPGVVATKTEPGPWGSGLA